MLLVRNSVLIYIKQFINRIHYKLFNHKKQNYLNIVIYPLIDKEAELKILLDKINWYLPQKQQVFLHSTIKINGVTPPNNVIFVDKQDLIRLSKNMDSLILLNNSWKLFSALLILRWSNIKIIDPFFYSYMESFNWQTLSFELLLPSEKAEFKKKSAENFDKMHMRYQDKTKAYCHVTGPSFDNYPKYNFDPDAIQIICNSIVKNIDFLNYINKPDILCFADAVFHFGTSEYARQFRKNVEEVVEKHQCFVILPDTVLPIFYYNYPNLRPFLIGIESKYIGDFNFPRANELWHLNTGNILSFLMIPIASSLVDEILIFGADGRSKKETYFWKHSKTAQYSTDLMESVFKAHPSFFRDRDYSDYYQNHCESLDGLILYGEALAKSYYSISDSNIPTLKKRHVKS